jgi:aryl-alcohol dehydrogenase
MVMRDQLVPVPQPVVLGHEGAGIIEAVGEGVSGLAVGDHVILSFASCGQCSSCHDHAPAYCHSWFPLNFGGMRADGSTALTDAKGAIVHSHVFGQSAFATHAVVPASNAIKVDAALPLNILGPLGCGIQTGAGAALKALQVRPNSSVAIIGAGAVGISAIMAAANIAKAAIVAAIDINAGRVALSCELGATHGFDPSEGSYAELAEKAGCPTGFDYIIDTTGRADLCNQAALALAPRGELALVGAYAPGTQIRIDSTFLMSGGRVIRGVVEGSADPAQFIPELIDHYRKGRFPFDRLIEMFDFADIAEAIEAGESGRVIKPIVRMKRPAA